MSDIVERLEACLDIPEVPSSVCRAISEAADLITSLRALVATPNPEATPLTWIEGVPPHPFDKEWFIALTTYGDRVVLTALPEEYTYDFKTADDTYIKADKIKRWMQFPDSSYIPFEAEATEGGAHEKGIEAAARLVEEMVDEDGYPLPNRHIIAKSIRALGNEKEGGK